MATKRIPNIIDNHRFENFHVFKYLGGNINSSNKIAVTNYFGKKDNKKYNKWPKP